MQAGLRRLFDQSDGGICAAPSCNSAMPVRLAWRQLRKVPDEGLPLNLMHDLFLKENSGSFR